MIPHHPLVGTVRIRGEALAQGLAGDFETYLLSWRYDPNRGGPAAVRAISRIGWFGDLLRGRQVHDKGKIKVIVAPILFVRREGLESVRSINTRIVNSIIRDLQIDFVVNELAIVNSADLARPHLIDIVDLPTPYEIRRWRNQARGAIAVTTVTEGIAEELRKNGIEARVVGNGADVARFRRAQGGAIRERYGLQDKSVIGYIGYHAEWSGLSFLLDVFKGVKKRVPEAALFIVGGGSEIPGAIRKRDSERIEDIVFAGPVEATGVAEYFAAIDLGVLPFELDPHAALSFPIKIVEYGAARKMVVASPLAVLRKIALPYVRIAEREVDAWAGAIVSLRQERWHSEWDAAVDRYDWARMSEKMASHLKSACPGGPGGS